MAEEIIIGMQRFLKYMDNLALRQLPFATKNALNTTAFGARRIVQNEMPKRFIIRRSWAVKGILVNRADKKTLTAEVFSRDEFMIKQETGGERKAKRGRLAIPDKIRTNIRKIVPRKQWPGKIIPKKGEPNPKRIFLMKHSVVKRKGGKKIRRKGAGSFESKYKILYKLRKQVRLKPRFGMRQIVEGAVLKIFPRAFDAEYVRVLQKEALRK